MPHDDADSGDEESYSDHDADLVTLEELGISEEERQEAINRVTFDQCGLVREAGERYRDGDSIPVIAAETGEPMMTVEKAVRTYYLIFAEPPIGRVSVQEFRDGRWYFVDSGTAADLDAETQTEAEEHVRAFMGRTLLDNDLGAVDIDEPVPEMPAWIPNSTEISDYLLLGSPAMSPLVDRVQEAAGLLASSQMHGVRQAVQTLSQVDVRELQQAAQTASRARRAMEPVVASSAAASSMAAASIGSGLDPAVVQMLNQPGVQEALRAVQTMPVEQLIRSLDQQLGLVSGIIEQVDALDLSVTGAAATMGVAAARPNVGQEFEFSDSWQAFEQPEGSWTPGELKPTDRGQNLDGGLSQIQPDQTSQVEANSETGRWSARVATMLLDAPLIIFGGTALVFFTFLGQQFPGYRLVFGYSHGFALIAIGIGGWILSGGRL